MRGRMYTYLCECVRTCVGCHGGRGPSEEVEKPGRSSLVVGTNHLFVNDVLPLLLIYLLR